MQFQKMFCCQYPLINYLDEDYIPEDDYEEKYEDPDAINYDCSKCQESYLDLLDLVEHFNKKHKKAKHQYQCPLWCELFVFFFSRFLITREKCISFAQLVLLSLYIF